MAERNEAGAEQCYRRAADVAERQGAGAFLLRADLALARLRASKAGRTSQLAARALARSAGLDGTRDFEEMKALM